MHDALEYAARIAYSSRDVLHFTYQKAKEYSDKPGVYVECGVAAGAQIIAMAAGAPNKTIYAFDSFEGIPLASNKDDQAPGLHFFTKAEQAALPNPGEQVLESSGATVVSLEDFYNHLTLSGINTDMIIPIEGWFEETVPFSVQQWQNAEGILDFKFGISILRLDGDLYNSTYVCLKYLYPKVIKGGLVIIDDWALPGCRQAVYDYFYGLPSFQSLNDQASATLAIELPMKFITDKNSTVAWWVK